MLMDGDRESGPEPKPQRLFIAVDLPGTVKAALASRVAQYRDRIPGARWTGSDGWHMTLKFLGATWPRLVEDVDRAVAAAAAATEWFESALTTVGVFPSARRARVVWAGLDDPGGRFAAIVKLLDEGLGEHFEPERRAFTPHLTLARLNPPRDVGEFVPELVGTSVASDRFPVDGLVLYRSHLSPRGATYEALRFFPFAS
jgi:RNA 2',3'-cyclic 3'-phosphodiesterase